MNIRNYLTTEARNNEGCHGGIGCIKEVNLFKNVDFATNLRIINYEVMPPETSIGIHRHGDDEEVYAILEGTGLMTVDGEERQVSSGDIIINKPFGSHGLLNNSNEDLRVLVFEVLRK